MEELIDHLPLWAKVVIPFIISNTGWFVRQWLWERRVLKNHKKIQEENRAEEEKTRAMIYSLHEKLGHLSIAMSEQITLSPAEKVLLEEIINGPIVG